MEKKKSNNGLIVILVIVFLGLPVLVGCVGILAAIAIPAFLRYTKKSKTTEAQAIVRSMASVAEMTYIEGCTFPEPLPPTFDPTAPACCGGHKCMPAGELPRSWELNAGMLNQPNYFSYAATPGPNDTFVITAMSDFACGDAAHTVTVTVQGSGQAGGCEATVSTPVVTNEFD